MLIALGVLAILFPLVFSIAAKAVLGWVFMLTGAALLYHASSGLLHSPLTADGTPFVVQWPGATTELPSHISASSAAQAYRVSRLAAHVKLHGSPSATTTRG